MTVSSHPGATPFRIRLPPVQTPTAPRPTSVCKQAPSGCQAGKHDHILSGHPVIHYRIGFERRQRKRLGPAVVANAQNLVLARKSIVINRLADHPSIAIGVVAVVPIRRSAAAFVQDRGVRLFTYPLAERGLHKRHDRQSSPGG